MTTFTRPLTPHWDDLDTRIYRTGAARDMIRAAGLSPDVARSIIYDASEQAGDNHDLFFKLIAQKITEHKAQQTPAANPKRLIAKDIVADVLEMGREGFTQADIAQYLKRTYGLE